jgi:flagellar assembly protein FliH
MACKIAADETEIEAIQWRSTPGLRSLTKQRAVTPSAPRPTDPVALDSARLAELDDIRQMELAQCRQAALEEGMRKGREAAANEIKAASDRVATTLRDLLAMKNRMRSQAEADVVKLSLAIARRIPHRELNADPESIQGIVYAGLQKLQNRQISSVRIPPAALEPVRGALERAGMAPAVTVVADPKMRAGDVIFETSLGELDCSIETQLQEIERGFADRLGL